MSSKETWALVTDGGKARIVALERHPAKFRELQEFTSPTRHQPGHELEGDARGRSHNVRGPGSHTHEPRVDPRDQQERQFTTQVLERLAELALAGKFSGLVIVADPRSLGHIRSQLPGPLKERTVLELNLDLTKLEPKKLEARLRKALEWPAA